MSAKFYVFVVLTAVLTFCQTVSAQYAIIDMGMLGGFSTVATAVNDSGQVVGYIQYPSGSALRTEAFLYDYESGTVTKLGTPGGKTSKAAGISNDGTIVGTAAKSNGTDQAFIWTTANGFNLIDIPGAKAGWATAINNDDDVLVNSKHKHNVYGYINTGYKGNLTDGFMPVPLFNTSGGKVLGTSDAGHIAGSANTGSKSNLMGNAHAFMYYNGVLTDMGTLGGNTSCAYAVNSSAVAVGCADVVADNVTYSRAFVWQNGVMTGLGTLGGANSCAFAINEAGAIVGKAQTADGSWNAFIYNAGVLTNLNSFLTEDSAFSSLTCAYDINAGGWIVGMGIVNGAEHAFLMHTPEPATVCLLGLGAASMICNRKKR